MESSVQTTLIEDEQNYDIASVIERVSRANWRRKPYSYQNWSNWLHRMSAYVGKTTPSMAHWLIRSSSRKGDKILDPFCGIGAIVLEADFLDRVGYGTDLNPYAYTIAKAKFDRHPKKEHIDFLKSIDFDTSSIDLRECSNFMKQFYHPETLKEILFLKEILVSEKKDFLLGCLLGIIHGHRPGHLSAVTSLVIPYPPKTEPIYKPVVPRLIRKVERMYKDGFKLKTDSKVWHADARDLPFEENDIDLVISSPPYFNTLDYVSDNRLRLEFLGYKMKERDKLKKSLIQNRKDYLNEMEKVGKELRRVLKIGSYCIFILGDLHSGKKVINTASEVEKIFEDIGFKSHAIIDDAMPTNKCVPSSSKRQKLDRILIMTNS